MATVAHIEEQKQEKINFKRIVIATDFSPASRQAMAYALAIGKRFGSEILVVHAIPPEPLERVPLPPELDRASIDAERAMRQLEQEFHLKDFKHQLVLEQGSVWDVLSFVMNRDHPGLLVLGTHGRGGLKKLALGSVAEEVLRVSPCPVLTIGPKAMPPGADVAQFKSILFATDFGPASIKAFPYALFLAEDCRAKLILLHMLPPVSMGNIGTSAYGPATYMADDMTEWRSRMQEDSLQRLQELVPKNARLTQTPSYMVATDFLLEGIQDTAMKYRAQLIVMGAPHARAPRLASHIPWTLTHDVLCEAQCPVLTVRD